jgi:glycosyltransferase involved in cell wall biosynthesis
MPVCAMSTSEKTKILFISRAYPPITGGIENQNYGIAESLSTIANVTISANPYGKKFIPVFFPWVTLRLIFTAWRYDAVLFGDGVTGTLGAILKILPYTTRVVSIIHGLDITFAHKRSCLGKAYRYINIPALKTLDRLIMVGNQTIEEAVHLGISRKKCTFIPNGVFVEDIFEPHTREELEKVVGMSLQDKKVVLRIGRYVKHKGTEWFIRNVVPNLPENTLFVAAGAVVGKATAGDESYYPKCVKAIRELGLENKVKLLTNLPWNDMKILFNTVDLAVSPNIRVPGSMEGFGINVIEAASCERVVVASNLEGLKDAITEGENGFLIEPENAQAFTDTITALLGDDTRRKAFGTRARHFSEQHFQWEGIAKQYLDIIQATLKK